MFERIFYPRSVAVIGASRSREKVGNIIFRNLLKCDKVKVFPINPNASEIEGIKCYGSVLDVKEEIDLAIVCVKNIIVPKVLEECGKKKIKFVIIISAGFSESGRKDLEEEILKIGKKYGIRIIGPNCFGVINGKIGLNTTFFSGDIFEGNVSIISQSGALLSYILDKLCLFKVGVSKVVSLGNACDISFEEILNYLNKDKDTEAIIIYLESVENWEKFYKCIKKLKKPTFILKGGKTSVGLRASLSHTASMMKDYDIFKDLIEVSNENIFLINDLKELENLIHFFNNFGSKKIERVVVISNAGGLCVLISDTIPELIKNISEETRELFRKIVGEGGSCENPIDLRGDADEKKYEEAIKVIKEKEKNSLIIVALTPQENVDPENVAKVIINNLDKSEVICMFMGGKKVESAKNLLRSKGYFVVESLSELRVLKWWMWRQ